MRHELSANVARTHQWVPGRYGSRNPIPVETSRLHKAAEAMGNANFKKGLGMKV